MGVRGELGREGGGQLSSGTTLMPHKKGHTPSAVDMPKSFLVSRMKSPHRCPTECGMRVRTKLSPPLQHGWCTPCLNRGQLLAPVEARLPQLLPASQVGAVGAVQPDLPGEKRVSEVELQPGMGVERRQGQGGRKGDRVNTPWSSGLLFVPWAKSCQSAPGERPL